MVVRQAVAEMWALMRLVWVGSHTVNSFIITPRNQCHVRNRQVVRAVCLPPGGVPVRQHHETSRRPGGRAPLLAVVDDAETAKSKSVHADEAGAVEDCSNKAGRWSRFRVRKPRWNSDSDGEREDCVQRTAHPDKKQNKWLQKKIGTSSSSAGSKNTNNWAAQKSAAPDASEKNRERNEIDNQEIDVGDGRLTTGAVARRAPWLRDRGTSSEISEDESVTSLCSPPVGDDTAAFRYEPRRGRGVTFSASHELTRILKLDERYNDLLNEYMTQPPEKFSVKSFHDSEGGRATGSRRWLVRRLSEHESTPFLQSRNNQDFDGGFVGIDQEAAGNNYFRIAVPLLPLLGLEITPVIDLEVLPASQSNSSFSSKACIKDDWKIKGNRDMLRGILKPGRFRKMKPQQVHENDDAVRIRSLKVSLLSTEDEVNKIMEESRTKESPPGQPIPDLSPTAVAQNESVRKMGYEAIGMIGTIQENLQPRISFEVRITWTAGDSDINVESRQRESARQSSVTVESTAVASLLIPSLPIALPSSVLIKTLGSVIMKRILKTATNRFLRQLERDFKRWADI